MPLQHSSAEAVETATVYGVSAPEATPGVSEPTHDGPRYDAAAVKEILARAEAMQARHRATLTPDAIIALGQEIGVEPEFVKRALAQTEAQASALRTHASARQQTRRKQVVLSGRALTRRQWGAALVPAALYLMLFPFTLFSSTLNMNLSSDVFVWLFIVFPAFLALCAGRAGKSIRVGIIGGGLLGVAVTFSLLVVQAFHHLPMPSLGEVLPVLALFAGSGMVFGATSAGLYRMISCPARKRLRVRFVVESEEINDTPNGEWA